MITSKWVYLHYNAAKIEFLRQFTSIDKILRQNIQFK
jgi:hypothetical protein